MAALRKVAALLGFRTAAAAVRGSDSVAAGRLQRRWAAGLLVAAGGAAVGFCWFGSRETRSHSSSISRLLASIAAVVEAKEKVGESPPLLLSIQFILKRPLMTSLSVRGTAATETVGFIYLFIFDV